jgi:hypothetical protein
VTVDHGYLLHIIEEGIEDRFIFHTIDGETFERPRAIEVKWPDHPDDEAVCSIETDDGTFIRPLGAIVSVKPAP